jgi:hypothetical protein
VIGEEGQWQDQELKKMPRSDRAAFAPLTVRERRRPRVSYPRENRNQARRLTR